MKLVFSFIIIALFSFSSFASGVPSENPTTTLYRYFPVAQKVEWSSVNRLQKATFHSEGIVYNAFFDQTGELLATTHAISLNDLPKALKASLKEEMQTYWISDLIVMTTSEGESYHVQLEYAGSKLIKQSSGNKWVTNKNL